MPHIQKRRNRRMNEMFRLLNVSVRLKNVSCAPFEEKSSYVRQSPFEMCSRLQRSENANRYKHIGVLYTLAYAHNRLHALYIQHISERFVFKTDDGRGRHCARLAVCW